MVSRANSKLQPGQIQGSVVKSTEMRSLKHLTNAPFPPFRYLKSWLLHLLQKISTVLLGPFLFGFAILDMFPDAIEDNLEDDEALRL